MLSTSSQSATGPLETLAQIPATVLSGCSETLNSSTATWPSLTTLGSIVKPDSEIRARISQGTEVVSVCRHDYASDTFAHEIDGKTITWFNPVDPSSRSGSDPDRLVDAMRDVGLDPDHTFEGPSIDYPIPSSFALASRITGLPFSQDMLNLRFLGAEPSEEE